MQLLVSTKRTWLFRVVAVGAMTATSWFASTSAHAQPPPTGQPAAQPATPEGQPPPPGGAVPAPDPQQPAPYPQQPAPYPQQPPPGYYPPQGYPPPPPAKDDRPREIDDWEEGDPIPPGYTPRGRIRKGLVIGGAVTLGSIWIVNVLVASVAMSVEEAQADSLGPDEFDTIKPEDWAPLYVPVVGPFIAMGTLEARGSGIAVLALDGIIQAGGLAMLIAGVAAEKTVLVRDYSTGFEMSVTPAVAEGFQGFGVSGKF